MLLEMIAVSFFDAVELLRQWKQRKEAIANSWYFCLRTLHLWMLRTSPGGY